ncbi:MAG: M48 family metalloprotease [Candidatus Omnitrophica bacterium]|nr:M48 family metalloprotease [Candidatus Omnitrophota bacterium]
MIKRWMAATALVFCLFSGCAYVEPFLRDWNVVSVPEERQIGLKMQQAVLKEMKIVEDPVWSPRLEAMGERLAAGLPVREFDYQFKIIADKSPNAFTIPGGFIYVHSGLIQFAGNEDEIAGVLAHEIGHAFARHPAKAMSRAYGVDYLSGLVFKDSKGALGNLALQIAKGGFMARFGRQDEYEADMIGAKLVRQAGYSPAGLLNFLEKIQKIQGQTPRPLAFLQTHPPTPERIARLRDLAGA